MQCFFMYISQMNLIEKVTINNRIPTEMSIDVETSSFKYIYLHILTKQKNLIDNL